MEGETIDLHTIYATDTEQTRKVHRYTTPGSITFCLTVTDIVIECRQFTEEPEQLPGS